MTSIIEGRGVKIEPRKMYVTRFPLFIFFYVKYEGK